VARDGKVRTVTSENELENDSRAAYLRLADALRADIAAGTLRPGDKVPSIRQLAERFGVAQMTAQNAVRLLAQEGFVSASPGRGNFVRATLPEIAPSVPEQLAELRRRVEALESRVVELERSSD
jgi:GntR family transcriptional regulator